MSGAWDAMSMSSRHRLLNRVASELGVQWPAPLALEDAVRATADAYAELSVGEEEVQYSYDDGHVDGYQAGWDAALDAIERLASAEAEATA